MRTPLASSLTIAIATMAMANPMDLLTSDVVHKRQLSADSCTGYLLCCSLYALAGDPSVSPILALYGIGIGEGYHVGTGCTRISSYPLASNNVCPAQPLCCTWAAAEFSYSVGIDCEPVAINL